VTLFQHQKVKQATEEVRDLADKAQADVGYDYIWLADVTYQDWQRYHALVGSERFCATSNTPVAHLYASF
jgi:hypothetical protein